MIYSKKYQEFDFLFLKDITELIITNLMALNDGLSRSIHSKDANPYMKKFYQSKLTLHLIGNHKLLTDAELINELLKVKTISEIDPLIINNFRNVCSREIKNLSGRLMYYNNYFVTPQTLA